MQANRRPSDEPLSRCDITHKHRHAPTGTMTSVTHYCLLLYKSVFSALQTTGYPYRLSQQIYFTLTARDVCNEIRKLPNFVAGWCVMLRNWLYFVHMMLSWLHTHKHMSLYTHVTVYTWHCIHMSLYHSFSRISKYKKLRMKKSALIFPPHFRSSPNHLLGRKTKQWTLE